MKTFHTRTLLIVGIVAVTLINLGAMTTVLVKYRQLNRTVSQESIPTTQEAPMPAPGHALMMQQMDFDENQRNQIRETQQAFRRSIRPLIQEINNLNARLLGELERQEIDTLEINDLCLQIGNLKAEMKMQTMFHLTDIRELATPAQLEQLYPFFREILTHDGDRPQGRGRHRHGRRGQSNP